MDRPLVLVVDDEKKILELLKSYLEINGYDCFCAQNGKEAINFFMQCQNANNVHTMRTVPNKTISLVLLDLMLPDLSGEEICKKIRALSDVPIIMITAKVDEESIIHGLNIGADDYMCKPFSPKQLMARVKAALRRQSGGANGATKNSLMIHGDLFVDTEKTERAKKRRGNYVDKKSI